MSDRMTGQVQWFSASKGYRFIGKGYGDDDVFVHFSWKNFDKFGGVK